MLNRNSVGSGFLRLLWRLLNSNAQVAASPSSSLLCRTPFVTASDFCITYVFYVWVVVRVQFPDTIYRFALGISYLTGALRTLSPYRIPMIIRLLDKVMFIRHSHHFLNVTSLSHIED